LFRRATFAITAAVCLLSAAAHAAPVSKPEPNEPFAAAQNVDAFFSLAFDPNIDNFAGVNTSTTVSHVEIVSPGDPSGTTDYYSFTVAAGDGVILDIDCGERSDTTCSSAVSIDSHIELYDPTGALFASNDDGLLAADTGSAGQPNSLDSIKEIALCGPGLWTVRVSQSPGSVGVPAGGDYILNISVGPGVGAVDTVSVGACPSGSVVPDTGNSGCGFFPNVTTLPLTGSETIVVLWCMHLSKTTVTNVAGVLYAAHYDETEVDLLHTGAPPLPPLFGNVTPFGQSNASPFAVPLSATFSPLPTSVPGSSDDFRQHIAWLSPSIANASGTTVNASSALNFATFSIQARHTPLTDNDPAFTVASAFPILHATASLEDGQFFAWNQTAQSFAFRAIIETNSFYIPFPAITAPPIMRTCGSCPNPLARPLCSRVA
jgi:hypothetical protein